MDAASAREVVNHEPDPQVVSHAFATATRSTVLLGLLRPELQKFFDIPQLMAYIDHVLAASGVADDPLGRMLVEQFIWSHQLIACLNIVAAQARTGDEAETYVTAIGRLMAEGRRTYLALHSTRKVPGAKPMAESDETAPMPPAVSETPAVQGAIPAATPLPAAASPVENSLASEVGSKEELQSQHAPETAQPSESSPSSRRPPKPKETRPLHAAGNGKPPANGRKESSLGKVDGPPDANRQSEIVSEWQKRANGRRLATAVAGGDEAVPASHGSNGHRVR